MIVGIEGGFGVYRKAEAPNSLLSLYSFPQALLHDCHVICRMIAIALQTRLDQNPYYIAVSV